MPVSETTINNKKDYRSWFIVAGIGLAVVVILGIILFVVTMLRSNSANSNGAQSNIPQTSIAAVDTTNPDTAVSKINTQLTQAFSNIQGNDPNAALKAITTALVGDTANSTHTKLAISYSLQKSDGKIDVEFQGDVQQNSAGQSEIQGSGTIHAQTTQTPDVTVPVDVILTNQVLYLKISTPTGSNLPTEFAYLGLLEGKYIKVNLQDYTSLPGVTATGTAGDVLDPTKRQDLIQSWTNNPPLINPRHTDDRTINGTTMQCMLADTNPNAFKDTTAAADYPPVEICTASGNAPVYIGIIENKDSQTITIGFTLLSFGENVSIAAPTGSDVIDLSGLLGNIGTTK